MTKLPYAEKVSYWRTGKSSPDTWIEKATKEVERSGGQHMTYAFGQEEGRAAYMLAFAIGPDKFKIVWPVLESRTGNTIAAKRQAATLLYHDVKARCLTARILGPREAFFNYMMLPDGRTAAQVTSVSELSGLIPKALSGYSSDE